jgi:hypothetical protein
VLTASRYDESRAVREPYFLPFHNRFALANFHAEELVDVWVHFLPYLSAHRDAHEHQLAVFPGPNHFPEIVIPQTLLFDITKVKIFHIIFD